ncbi:MAG: hypothetical protein ACM3SQ_10705 [Betaproteobacteria bacterium]
MRSIVSAALSAVLIVAAPAAAADGAGFSLVPVRHATDPWHVSFGPENTPAGAPLPTLRLDAAAEALPPDGVGQPVRRRPVVIEYSDAYQRRLKIHRYASFATLPLFGAELALGQSLYNNSANVGARRTAHAWIGAGIFGLFGVNTVTGAWNLFGEGRKDPNHRTLRLVHGLLMMAADVGFLATTASGPNSRSFRHALTFETDKVTHRNIAVASMSVGTLGYLIMLFGNR